MGVKEAELILDTLGPKKAKAHTVADGTVVSVKGSTAYVTIDGGAQRVPCQLAMAAKAGDKVKVSIYNHSAVVTGNTTEPATGDAEAKAARERADDAFLASQQAQASAQTAESAAQIAGAAATAAQGSAAAAQTSANAAATAANTAINRADAAVTAANTAAGAAEAAQKSADSALHGLSAIEDVVGTVNWIAQHGTMELTEDTAIDASKVYYVVDQDGPIEVGGVSYSSVTEPDVADISTYYELSLDESVQNYIGTHLALTNEGLQLTPDSSGYKVLVAVGGTGHTYSEAGTYIIDGNGTTVASFRGTGVSFDSSRRFTVGDSNAYILYENGTLTISGKNVVIGGSATLDGWARTFTTTPDPPYSVGDLWLDPGNTWGDVARFTWGEIAEHTWGDLAGGGAIRKCVTARGENDAFRFSDWEYEAPYATNQAAADASETATGYISDMTSGIFVHPKNDATTGWRMTDVLEYVRRGASWIKGWVENNVAKFRVGLESAAHVLIDSDGIGLYGANGKIGQKLTSSSSKFYDANGDTVADIGSTATIGKASGSHIVQDGSSFTFYGESYPSTESIFISSITNSTIGIIDFPSGGGIISGADPDNGNGTNLHLESHDDFNFARIESNEESTGANAYVWVEARTGSETVDIRASDVFNVTSNLSYMSGDLHVSGTVTQGSDRRMKEHISYLSEDACEFVRKLRPALFKKDGSRHTGFYAQDVRDADEWGTKTVRPLDPADEDSMLGLGYEELIAPLVAYCQQLEKRIERLEGEK